MEIHWDDLRLFLAVARSESISGAGRVLKIDPATVGRRIKRLEDGIGSPLFAKSPLGYALTDDGHRLLVHAERAEQSVAQATEEVRGQSGKLTGLVRIGAPDGCANYLLPQVCTQIVQHHPGLELQIVALPRVFNLSKREADMAIAVSAPASERMAVQKITDYKLHLAASQHYLENSSPINGLSDLAGHRIVGYIPDMIFDKELDYLADINADRLDLASNSVSVQFNLIRQNGGVGIAHDFALPSAPEVRRILPHDIALTRSFFLIRHRDDQRVERLNRVADALVSGLRQEVSRLEAQLDS